MYFEVGNVDRTDVCLKERADESTLSKLTLDSS